MILALTRTACTGKRRNTVASFVAHRGRYGNCENKAKAVPLHAIEALGDKGRITPTLS
jgi:hypothetical protein